MAKVQFINAILSGKLAGTVYARNKAGYYVRNWTKPLDPRTTAQIDNRTQFSNAASAWHSMSEAEKAAWNVYGMAFFIPKGGATPSPVSGFNAFTSTYYTAQVMQLRARTNTITFPAGVTATFLNYVPTTTAPTAAISGDIQDSTGAPLPLLLTAATFTASTAATEVTFTFPAPQNSAPIFRDAVTNKPVGFLVQISNAKNQMEQFTTNPRIRAINYIKPPDTLTGWTSGNKITFQAATNDLDTTKFKEWYVPGQTVQISAYIVSQDGQQKLLGSVQTVAL